MCMSHSCIYDISLRRYILFVRMSLISTSLRSMCKYVALHVYVLPCVCSLYVLRMHIPPLYVSLYVYPPVCMVLRPFDESLCVARCGSLCRSAVVGLNTTVVWSLWFGSCDLVAVVWSLWFARCGLVAVIWSLCRSVAMSVSHYVGQSLCRSVTISLSLVS